MFIQIYRHTLLQSFLMSSGWWFGKMPCVDFFIEVNSKIARGDLKQTITMLVHGDGTVLILT